jgi:hypothetical protein
MLVDSRPRDGCGVARPIAGYGAVVCALPYLALKVNWLVGGTLGVANVAMMREGSMVALNAITAGMDVVAILIAMALTHQWGLRLPAWLLLPPMWVATGLLSRFVLVVPVVAAAEAMASSSVPRATSGPVQPWVYALVYTEFVGLGIGLMLAFVLHARSRWPSLFESTTRGVPPGQTHAVQIPLASTAALMAAAVGGLHMAWAVGATMGLRPELATRRTFSSSLVNGVDAALMFGAAAGILMLVHRWGRQIPFWLPLALAWLGGGSLFGWGAWRMINVLPNTALLREQTHGVALFNFVGLISLVTGLIIGLVIMFLIAERIGASATMAVVGTRTSEFH